MDKFGEKRVVDVSFPFNQRKSSVLRLDRSSPLLRLLYLDPHHWLAYFFPPFQSSSQTDEAFVAGTRQRLDSEVSPSELLLLVFDPSASS
jgi:hypothetical protein